MNCEIISSSGKEGNAVLLNGFLLFDCPLKSTTRSTVSELIQNKYQVKIITGDNAYTACEIARQCGIIEREHEVLILNEDHQG